MSKELFWLTLTTAMTGLFWLPYILDRIIVRGLIGAIRRQHQRREYDKVFNGIGVGAHLPLGPARLRRGTWAWIGHALGISTAATATACAVFFWARLAHYLVFTFGIPVARTLSFAAGFAAQVALVLAIFKLI